MLEKILEKRVVEKCWRRVLEEKFVEQCWRRGLYRPVVEVSEKSVGNTGVKRCLV